jgi:hypothetical protein
MNKYNYNSQNKFLIFITLWITSILATTKRDINKTFVEKINYDCI